jgi:hypothetical protein
MVITALKVLILKELREVLITILIEILIPGLIKSIRKRT